MHEKTMHLQAGYELVEQQCLRFTRLTQAEAVAATFVTVQLDRPFGLSPSFDKGETLPWEDRVVESNGVRHRRCSSGHIDGCLRPVDVADEIRAVAWFCLEGSIGCSLGGSGQADHTRALGVYSEARCVFANAFYRSQTIIGGRGMPERRLFRRVPWRVS